MSFKAKKFSTQEKSKKLVTYVKKEPQVSKEPEEPKESLV